VGNEVTHALLDQANLVRRSSSAGRPNKNAIVRPGEYAADDGERKGKREGKKKVRAVKDHCCAWKRRQKEKSSKQSGVPGKLYGVEWGGISGGEKGGEKGRSTRRRKERGGKRGGRGEKRSPNGC